VEGVVIVVIVVTCWVVEDGIGTWEEGAGEGVGDGDG